MSSSVNKKSRNKRLLIEITFTTPDGITNYHQGTAQVLLVLLAIHDIAAQKVEEPGGTEGGQLQIINGEDADKGEFPFMVSQILLTKYIDSLLNP
jgi:hypothetical protein